MATHCEIPIEEFAAIPFFDRTAWTPARDLSTLMFYVKGEWHCWIGAGGKLHKMQMWPSEGGYFADFPERPTDRYFRLLDLTAQRASFPDMRRASAGIWNDFQNLATSLAKIRLFFEVSKTRDRETSRFVQTEIEYIVLVCRSVFDLLQEMVASHWDRIQLLDKSIKKRHLPKSFAAVLFSSNKLLTSGEIARKYGLPSVFAEWYAAQASFFVTLRKLRDSMAHLGINPIDLLFRTERGYAIQRGERLWSEFYDWPKEVELPNQLVPIRPVLCAIIWRVIEATDSFAQILEQSIVLPRPLFPGLFFFSRGYYDRELQEIDYVLKNSVWCDSSADITRELAFTETEDEWERTRVRAYYLALERGGGQLPAYNPVAAAADFSRAAEELRARA